MEGSSIGSGIALVTGGNSFLGSHITRELKRREVEVVISYRNESEDITKFTNELGINAYRADLTSMKLIEDLFSKVEKRHGDVRYLVLNASTFHTGSLEDMDEGLIRETIEGVIYPVIFPILRSLPSMKRNREGSMVLLGMAGTQQVRAYREVAAHAAAKTAVNVLFRSLAHELSGTGVQINMVSPGIIRESTVGSKGKDSGMERDPGKKETDPIKVSERVADLLMDSSMHGQDITII